MLHFFERLPKIIDAIGDVSFGSTLLSLLRDEYGADHCAIFLLSGRAPQEIASCSFDGSDTAHRRTIQYLQTDLWRRDPTMSEAWSSVDSTPRVSKLDVSSLADRELRACIYPQVAQRLLLCGATAAGTVALSIVKSEAGAPLAADTASDIERSAPVLLSILGKHVNIMAQKANLYGALTSLPCIESVIMAAPEAFPRREAQVCARILYGIYTPGIALELGICEETVATYRKRIYIRLGLTTQRDLLLWYVRRWSEFTANEQCTAAPVLSH
jgi:DNA-binding CsgD family transcriptional regulator